MFLVFVTFSMKPFTWLKLSIVNFWACGIQVIVQRPILRRSKQQWIQMQETLAKSCCGSSLPCCRNPKNWETWSCACPRSRWLLIRRSPSKNFVEIWNTNLLVLIMGLFANAAKARVLAAPANSLLASMLAPVLVRGELFVWREL